MKYSLQDKNKRIFSLCYSYTRINGFTLKKNLEWARIDVLNFYISNLFFKNIFNVFIVGQREANDL